MKYLILASALMGTMINAHASLVDTYKCFRLERRYLISENNSGLKTLNNPAVKMIITKEIKTRSGQRIITMNVPLIDENNIYDVLPDFNHRVELTLKTDSRGRDKSSFYYNDNGNNGSEYNSQANLILGDDGRPVFININLYKESRNEVFLVNGLSCVVDY